eukprot:COSAG03_NODE_24257_length_273_cov_1.787356_1_plen_54_part_01
MPARCSSSAKRRSPDRALAEQLRLLLSNLLERRLITSMRSSQKHAPAVSQSSRS